MTDYGELGRTRESKLSQKIASARRNGHLLEPLTAEHDLSLAEAYDIQDAILQWRENQGQRHVGWKIGYTSAAMREQMGITEPNFGPLTDTMILQDGGSVSPHVIQPRVEPEILVQLAAPVTSDMKLSEIRQQCGEIRCALEVVDPVWRDYQFQLEDNTADGSSAAHAVVGPQVPGKADVGDLSIEVVRDNLVKEVGSTKSVMGHPLEALRWLAETLDSRGRALRTGDLILTGGATRAVHLPSGSTVSATFQGVGAVSVHRV